VTDASDTFLRHRGLIFTLAYDLLGSVADAEDVVQDVYERWLAVDHDVEHARAYLARMTTNLCLDVLRSAERRRVDYVGPWLPEPLPADGGVLGPEEQFARHEAVSAAFLVILQALGDRERAGFVLRELFAFSYAEVAHILDMEVDGARQMIHRARDRVQARRRRFAVTTEQHDRVVERFIAAVQAGDITGLISTLAPDAVLTVDGGGKVSAARRPVTGAEAIVRFLFGLQAKVGPAGTIRGDELNGGLSVLSLNSGTVDASFQFAISGATIEEIYVMRNPDKLQRLQPGG
jgi:RNA polymerase sigma-70 factor (ECF subfamily)